MRDLDGSKVLVKLAENPFAFAKRCRPFFGGTEFSDYTIESDVRAMERRRQMGDIGIVAQRYELVLFGSHQRLELQPWQPETQRTARVPFTWTKDAWYTMKLEVQNMGGGKVRARGKVWPKGEAEPAAWTIERIDPIGSAKGRRRALRRRAVTGRRRVASSTTTTSRCSRTRNESGSGIRDPGSAIDRQMRHYCRARASARAVQAGSAPPYIGIQHTMKHYTLSIAIAALDLGATLALVARSDPGGTTGRCGAARPTATWSRT